MASFKEIIGNVTSWIKKAIKAVWSVFKVIVKSVIKFVSSFIRSIGEFIRDCVSGIKAGIKKVFLVKTPKGDLIGIIQDATNNRKTGTWAASPEELFGAEKTTDTKKAEYDYHIVVTDADISKVEKVETISADEIDRQIDSKFYDDVTEMKL